MTAATLATATSGGNRKAVIAGTIGNVLEWYDFGVYGYLATTMSQLFFPGEDKTISLLKAFAVFGVGFVMRPVGSVVFMTIDRLYGRGTKLTISADGPDETTAVDSLVQLVESGFGEESWNA